MSNFFLDGIWCRDGAFKECGDLFNCIFCIISKLKVGNSSLWVCQEIDNFYD